MYAGQEIFSNAGTLDCQNSSKYGWSADAANESSTRPLPQLNKVGYL